MEWRTDSKTNLMSSENTYLIYFNIFNLILIFLFSFIKSVEIAELYNLVAYSNWTEWYLKDIFNKIVLL